MTDRENILLRHVDIFFKIEGDDREIPLFVVNGIHYSSSKDVEAATKEARHSLRDLGYVFVIESRPIKNIGIFRNLPSWTEYRKKLGKTGKRHK